MRKPTLDDLKIDEQIDLLKGNINRMCVTDDMMELQRMFDYARIRLNNIHSINFKRLTEEDDED